MCFISAYIFKSIRLSFYTKSKSNYEHMVTIEIALYFLLDIPIIILTVSRTKRRFIRSTFIMCIYGKKQKTLPIKRMYLM